MNKLELVIANIIVRLLDLVTIGLKINKNKITYISYKSNELPENMKLISRKVEKINPDIEQVFLTMKYTNTLLNKFKYAFELLKQAYNIKTSAAVIIDANNFVISNIKCKGTKVIQVWHASGAIKKFGHDYKRKYEIKNYDYMIAGSSTAIEYMSSAFNMRKDQVVPLGYCTTDLLFNKNKVEKYKKEMYIKYPYLEGKKVVLYAPTFRGEGIYDKDFIKIDLKKIATEIGEEYVVISKLHPIIEDRKVETSERVYNLSYESIYKLFSITDILVSDFSAIIYDFSILEKPILLYVPDLDEYSKNRGMYVDYKKFAPGKVVYNENQLVDAINNKEFYIDKVKKLKEEFFDYKDGKSSERVAKFIIDLIDEK